MNLSNKIVQRDIRTSLGLSGTAIKTIGTICMLIDHISKTFIFFLIKDALFPMSKAGKISATIPLLVDWFNKNIMYSIGAIAFPLFCFAIVEGYKYTENKSKLLRRLFVFALISEIPFDLAFFSSAAFTDGTYPFYWYYQNVFFTYFLGLVLLQIIDKISMVCNHVTALYLQCIFTVITCFLAEKIIHCDYGGYGIFLITLLYALRKKRSFQIADMLFVPLVIHNSHTVSYLISILIISAYNGKRGKNLKWFFYIFYPAHILLLYAFNSISFAFL